MNLSFLEGEQSDRESGNLAMSCFACDLENEKDAIYDNWKERYQVQEK